MRCFVTFPFLLFNLYQVTAQDHKFGFIAGVNASVINYIEQGVKVGFQAGAIAVYPLSETARLSLDFKYTQKGETKRSVHDSDSSLWKIKLNYIETNMMLRLKVWKGINIYGASGYGFLVDKELETIQGQISDYINNLPFTRHDVSLSGGLSFQVFQGLNINLGLQYSVATLYKGRIYVGKDPAFFNGVWSLTVDYQFYRRKSLGKPPGKNVRYL